MLLINHCPHCCVALAVAIKHDIILLVPFQQFQKAKYYSTSQHKINLPKTSMVPE